MADTTSTTAAAPAKGSRLGSALLADTRRILLPRLMRLAAVIAGGLMTCLSFPPFDLWYLVFPAFGLFGWVLTREDTTRAGGFGYGFLFGLAFYVPLLPWISGLVGAAPWLVLSAMEALFPALFGLLAVVVRRVPGWPVWFAAVWGLTEWLKSVIPFGGFPWGAIAFGQTDGPLLALVQWGGAPLLSFATVLVGFSLAALIIEGVRRWRSGSDAPSRGPAAILVPGICIVLVMLSVAAASPRLRKSGSGAGDDPAVTVAAIQGNVPRLGLEFNAQRRAVLDNHVAQTERLARDVREGRAPQPAFVLWPENSSDIDPTTNADAARRITAAAEAIRAPILVGSVLAAPGYSPEKPESTNTAIVWDPVTGPGDRHDKKIIQPFGEYLPWRSFFRLLSSYADRAGYFIPGNGSGVVRANGLTVGVTTCWEVIFDRAARAAVLNGAQFLAVPANNATFNAAMSAQQLAFGKLRAVEHDRYVVVAGTVGISAVVAPDGRELAKTGFFEPAYLDTQIRLKSDLTPATRWGPVVQVLLLVLGGGVLLAVMLHNGMFLRRRKAAVQAAHDDEGAP